MASRSVASPPSPYVVPFSFSQAPFSEACRRGGVSALRAQTLVAIVAFAAAVVGCQRTPEEPPTKPAGAVVEVPLASSSAALTEARPVAPPPSARTSVKKNAGCIAPTPDVAPGPVPRPAASCPKDPDGASMLPQQSVSLDDAHTVVRAEIARAPHDLEKGLMFRTQMPEDAGMLFRLGDRSVHRFWMHNTCIPLDLLFIDDDGTIVGIVENAPTLNDEERSVPCRSSFVLEVNAGYSRRHNVRAGQHATLPPS